MQIKTKLWNWLIPIQMWSTMKWSSGLFFLVLSGLIPLFCWFRCLISGTSEGGSLTSLGVNTSEQKKSSLFLPYWEINLLQSVRLPCCCLSLSLCCFCFAVSLSLSLRRVRKVKRYNQINIASKPPAAGVPLHSAGVNYSDPYQDFRSQTRFSGEAAKTCDLLFLLWFGL